MGGSSQSSSTWETKPGTKTRSSGAFAVHLIGDADPIGVGVASRGVYLHLAFIVGTLAGSRQALT